MKVERTKRSLNNILAGMLNKITALLVPFVIRTLMIQKLGVEYLGLDNLFSSILQMLSLTELGFGSAMVYSMYKPIADGDDEKVCALLNFYKKIYRWLGLIILTIGLCITPFITHFIAADYSKDINIYVIYIIYLLNTVVSYFLYAYKSSLLAACMRSDIDSLINALCNLLLYGIQAIVLLLLRNYYIYAILIPVFTCINNIVRSCQVDKVYPNYHAKGSLDKETIEVIKKKVFALMGHRIGGVVFSSVDSVVVSSFLGLTILGKYSNYFYIYTSINGIVSIIFSSIIAVLGNSIAIESTDKNYKNFNMLFLINTWLTGWCSICLLCLYQPFMKLWMGKENMLNFQIVILLSVYYYVANIRRVENAYKDAAGMWNADFWKPYVSVVVNLTVNIILVKAIGLAGVIISSIIALLFVEIPWEVHVLFKGYFKRSEIKYFCKWIVFTVIYVIIAIGTYKVCELIQGTGIINIIERGIVCCIMPNIIVFLICFRTVEFKAFYGKVKNSIFKH